MTTSCTIIRETAEVELRCDCGAQRVGIEARQIRQAAEMPRTPHRRNGLFGMPVLVSDEGAAKEGNIARADRGTRQQRVIDGAERGAGAQHQRRAPAREYIEI